MSTYIEYLQHLLSQSKINFQSQEEFEKRSIKVQEQPLTICEPSMTPPLIGDLVSRYSRQMLLKQISYAGQLKILNTKIAIIGSGGIGCPLALYLAGAGVGTIGLFDSDQVDVTNLHRQIGHKTSTVGVSKTKSLKESLLSLNPNIKIEQHPFINSENVKILRDFDLVVDGSDNPQCRYIVNDFCMSQEKRLLSGACIGWEAQVTCYGGGINPCYRCIWGDQQVSLGGCSSLGVVGMIPGFVGIILAIQALKMILDNKSSLEGYLLTYSAKKCEFKKIKLRNKKQDCIACGKNRLDLQKYDYSRYGTCATNKQLPAVPCKSWKEFLENPKFLLDVRPQAHYKIVNFESSKSIPYEQLILLPKEKILEILQISEKEELWVFCVRGAASKRAVSYLLQIGLEAYSLQGGILQYRRLYDKDIPLL